MEIFNFQEIGENCISSKIKIFTRSPAIYSWYTQVPFSVYVNDVYVGEMQSSARGEEGISELEVDPDLFYTDKENNLFMVYGGTQTSQNELTQIWWVEVECEIEGLPDVPKPTDNSIVMTTSQWKNVISSSPLKVPVVVSEGLGEEVSVFIDDYEPDYIYTIGMDIGLNNSFEISYNHVPDLFFPNYTNSVYVSDEEQGIIGSQIAYLLDIPIVFDEPEDEFIDLSEMSFEEIQEEYIRIIGEEGENINYLVLANMESDEALLAGRISGKRKGFVVPVWVEDIGYVGTIVEVNSGNEVEDIIDKVLEEVTRLGEEGLYHKSTDFRKNREIYLAIVGDDEAFPLPAVFDPGIEIIDDKDSDRIYSDYVYSELNGDNYLEIATGRFWGGLEPISLQMERTFMSKSMDAVLIGQYKHRKYEDAIFMGGGMTQASDAKLKLEHIGFEVRNLIEKRTGFNFDIGFKDMFELGARYYNLYNVPGASIVLKGVSFAWTVIETGELLMYYFLEYDWFEWSERVRENRNALPNQYEVFSEDSIIGEPGIIGYFGLGDDHWIVPPDDRNDAELVVNPYGRATDFETLEFSNLLIDDHDMSASSGIAEQVLERGGHVLGSTGIIHDPYTILYTERLIGSLAMGKSTGDSMRTALNKITPRKAGDWLAYRPGELPNLQLKDRFERILLGDPAFRPIQDGVVEADNGFEIRPYNSFLAEDLIRPEFVIKNRKVIVEDPDDYLIENGRPIVPVFVREFMLPEGSVIKDVSFRPFYRTYKNIEPNVIPWDEYYEGMEKQEGDHPEERFWYETNEMIDGKMLVRVIVPGVLYNKKAKVLRWGKIKIEYESPVEVIIKAKDFLLGKAGKIRVDIVNRGEEEIKGNLWVWVGNEELSEEVDVKPGGREKVVFVFDPEEAGEFPIKAVLDSEISPGPRYESVTVYDRCNHRCSWLPFWLKRMLSLKCDKTDCCESIWWMKDFLGPRIWKYKN